MVRIEAGEGDPEDLDRIANTSDEVREYWGRTIEDTQAMMADREGDGYETLMITSADTTPKYPDDTDDEWGLSYVIPSNSAEEYREFAEGFDFDETVVYQQSESGTVFIVTECIDLEAKRSLFVAGAYRMRFAPEMVRTALDRGSMRSHLKTLDGETIAAFEHDDPDAFFPEPEEFYAYETDEMFGIGEE